MFHTIFQVLRIVKNAMNKRLRHKNVNDKRHSIEIKRTFVAVWSSYTGLGRSFFLNAYCGHLQLFHLGMTNRNRNAKYEVDCS